jgi:predicted nuclease of restriction endonuclease-like RecB superfamily
MSKCPNCGKPKKGWFKLCFDCNEKLNQVPKCEICNIEVPQGHTLCKPHWKEKQEHKKKLKQIDFVKNKKNKEFRDKFEGKFYFNGMKVKSKSELLLLYFFEANGLHPRYEDRLTIKNKEYRPDFILEKGDTVIIVEHFGLDDKRYNERRDQKIKEYSKLCEDPNWFFIWTNEEDMYNLKDILGKKLNDTPLKKVRWK